MKSALPFLLASQATISIAAPRPLLASKDDDPASNENTWCGPAGDIRKLDTAETAFDQVILPELLDYVIGGKFIHSYPTWFLDSHT
jgi:hypothetical protein